MTSRGFIEIVKKTPFAKSSLVLFGLSLIALLALQVFQNSRYRLYFVFEIGHYNNETPIVRPGVFEQQILNELREKRDLDFKVRIKSEKDYLIAIWLNGSSPQELIETRKLLSEKFFKRHRELMDEQKSYLASFLKKESDLVRALGFNKEDFMSLQSYLGPSSYGTRIVVGESSEPLQVRLSFPVYFLFALVFSLIISMSYLLIVRFFAKEG